MTSNLASKALALVYTGNDFNLYFRYANTGDITKFASAPWGGKNRVRHEPSTLFIWGGGIRVFTVDASNGHLMVKSVSESNLGNDSTGWYDLGGLVAGSPVSVYYDEKNSKCEAFVVGFDGQVWGCYYDTKWNWTKIPISVGNVPVFEPERLAASTDGQGRIDLVAVSITNDIYHRWFNGSVWSHWNSVGKSAVGSRPVVWTSSADRVDIVCKDAADHRLYHTANENGVWLGWQQVGDTKVILDPAGSYCTESKTRVHVAATAVDGSISYSYLNWTAGQLGSWTAQERLGGVFSSSPKVAHRAGGIIDVFGRGMASDHYVNTNSGGKWGGWIRLTGLSQTKPC